jgi:capsular polysaccharide biosynthesis protein
MEESRYITDIFKTIKKYIWVIILFMIIGGVAGKILSLNGPAPTYQAYALVLLEEQQKDSKVIINQSDANVRFLNTAQTLVYTPVVLDSVTKDLKLDYSRSDLINKITAANENSSQVMRITVEDGDAKKATEIVNKIADVFERDIKDYLNVEKVQIVERAQAGQELRIVHSRPNANILMGIIIGLVIGTLVAFVLDFFFKNRKASV